MPREPPSIAVLGLNYPPEQTGIAPYTGAMSRGLVRRGSDVRVLTGHPHYPAWAIMPGYGKWTQRETLDSVHVQRMRHFVPSRPKGIARLVSEVTFGARLQFTRWGAPDVLLAISPALISTAMALGRSRLTHGRTPFIVWVQDIYSLGLAETGQSGGATVKLMRALESWVLRTATCVVVIHDRFARYVVDELGVSPDRVEVIRNWSHLPTAPPVDREAFRKRLGWLPNETVVLHAGNMGVKQGLENVVEAARLAEAQQSDVRFVMLGGGGEKSRLVELGTGIHRLQFIEPLPDAEFAEALQAADILLVNEKPGVAEMAVPSKLTSYFTTGRPVIAATAATGITAEELRNAGAGEVVPAGDPMALLEAVVALGRDPERAQKFGENGLRYRRSVLDDQVALDRFAALIDRVSANNT